MLIISKGMADTIGMMNLAYAISKVEVLKWINDLLKVGCG